MPSYGAGLLLIVSVGLFATYFVNVVSGASGAGAFLSDIGELLILFASCIFFVAATLQLEKQRSQK